MKIDPILTAHPVTGAVRHITADLLSATYLAPRTPTFDLKMALQQGPSPCRDSFTAARAETAMAIERGIVALARATKTLSPEAIEMRDLPDGRARRHLSALGDLWRQMGDALPDDVGVLAHVLRSEPDQAVEALPVLDPTACAFSDPAEVALIERLVAHHGSAPPEARAVWQSSRVSPHANATGALGHLQASLTSNSAPVHPDSSVAVFGLRDPSEEAAFAAARTRQLLDSRAISAPQEVGLLIPDDAIYLEQLAQSFDALGLPLAGLPVEPATRDHVGELLTAALAILRGPAPRTALASLFTSPLAPWSADQGALLARETMENGRSRSAKSLEGISADLVDTLRPVATTARMMARLQAIAATLPDPDAKRDFRSRVALIGASQNDEAPDWTSALRKAAARPNASTGSDRFVEGVSLFTESALPWRPVRQLIVLGMAGRAWPRPAPANPLFTDSEIAQIKEHTGLTMRARADVLNRKLELFRRQLCAASEGATLLVPARDAAGKPLAPATALALIGRALRAAKPEDLVTDLRAMTPAAWPVAHRLTARLPGGGAPEVPDTGILRIGTDLLRIRREDDGRSKPQSPSRLETLIVSPLAWVLEELGAKDRTWAPECLDVLVLGSIVHEVLEILFPKAAPIPDMAQIEAGADAALDTAIGIHAPFLSATDWAAERASLAREVRRVALSWARFLTANGAEILDNEFQLAGDQRGLRIAGRADTLLRLADGRIVIVDHKRSASKGRRGRMEKGWDLQVALYRAMMERPEVDTELTRLVTAGVSPVTAYHLTNDGTILTGPAGAGIPGAQAVVSDIAEHALDHLDQTIAAVGAGDIVLNRSGDAKRIRKDRGITPYALENNSFLAAFALSDLAEEPDDDE